MVALFCFSVYLGFQVENPQVKIILAKKMGLADVPQLSDGLPYYTMGALNPVWDKKAYELVVLPDYEFKSEENENTNLKVLSGKNTVLGFIFTSCAGICPILVEKLKVLEETVSEFQEANYVLISVDPEFDTPDVLQEFAERHELDGKSNWYFLTAGKEQTYHLIRKYFASEVKELGKDDLRKFAHTEHFYLFDKTRHMRSVFNGTRMDMQKLARASMTELGDSSEKISQK